MNDLFSLALSRIKGLGPVGFKKLIDIYGSPERVWNLDSNKLKQDLGVNTGTKIANSRNAIDMKVLKEVLNEKRGSFVSLGDPQYPRLLREISDPPINLFFKGNLKEYKKCITVVGTRSISDYGSSTVRRFVKDLVDEGFCIVSGLAFGVDTLAHRTALENNGETIAVIGTPINVPSPSKNFRLFEEITKKGLVFSEVWYEEEVRASNFARRNRILAGLSPATLVIEAPERSGALITAHLAFDYNRNVFAVPGNINKKMSKGCNNIIKNQKAVLVNDVGDILEELSMVSNKSIDLKASANLNALEKNIYDVLLNEPQNVEQIQLKVDINNTKLLASLVSLEIKGLINKDFFNRYYIS